MRQAIATNTDTDPKRKLEVDEKMQESNCKVALLNKALQRYQGLYIRGDEQQEGARDLKPDNDHPPLPQSSSSSSIKTLRRPCTGRLKGRLITSTGLPGKKSSKSETYFVIRVDGVPRAQSKPARGKWNDDIDIPLDKAQDIEIAVYEKGGVVLGLVWFKLWELEEALKSERPARVERDDSGHSSGLSQTQATPGTLTPSDSLNTIARSSAFGPDGLETWLDMEPGGQLCVKLNLVPESKPKKNRKDGLLRRKPVQKLFPKRGHKFVAQQFYQVVKCAVCSDFLVTGNGYQCQSCKFTCHKKCQTRVLTKCIAKSNEEHEDEPSPNDPSQQLLRHRIPHRFESYSPGMSAHWCTHCGYMLPFGKNKSLKCTECSAACHKECMHLVPDFCGLNAEMVKQMMGAIEQAERTRKEKAELRLQEKAEIERKGRELHQQQLQQSQPSQQSLQQMQQPQLPRDGNRSSVASMQSVLSAGSNDQMVPSPSVSATTVVREPSPPRFDSVGVLDRVVPKGICLDDFNFIAVLGKGNFGKVMLAEERYSKQLFAIKVLKKEFIIENDEVESTKAEKRVFLTANRARHPFLVNLHSCFQTESRVYFVMEYVSGGDLMWHIQHRHFTPQQARFYAAEILLALEYFHKNNIVYRDLKLDNILLSLDGHIKIADYGLCKENMPYGATTNTFCGTPEFMAPEILLDKPYTRAVDWWAFGVLIYEMLLGQSPFRGDDEEEIFEAILEDEILYPVNMQKEAVSLLQKLLTKDPSKRLGASKADAEDIKKHPYFKGIDWNALLQFKITPPFYPKISSPTDTSNFDEEFTKEVPVLTPCNSVLSAADQEEFRGFTYISDWAKSGRDSVVMGNR
ncbi:kinase-like domain-containing protein [Gaertneriomyces semiglobifer]|nr:kinase-like domain-containing protein [Gaertneriomyces semiglobifer]